MKKEVVKKENLTFEKLQTFKDQICPTATDSELKFFLEYCIRTKLDPIAKEIYLIKRAGKVTVQTGIDGYRILAERTGQYAGNDDYIFDEKFMSGSKHPTHAKSTVYRFLNGERIAFSSTARWDSYVQKYWKDGKEIIGNMWQKFPDIMLGKCAEALALRKAFPNALSGIYTTEEMAQAEELEPEIIKVEELNKKYNDFMKIVKNGDILRFSIKELEDILRFFSKTKYEKEIEGFIKEAKKMILEDKEKAKKKIEKAEKVKKAINFTKKIIEEKNKNPDLINEVFE